MYFAFSLIPATLAVVLAISFFFRPERPKAR